MKKPGKLTISDERLFDKMPSGSGLVLAGDSVFVVADDAPFIYQVALKDHSYKSIPLQHYGNADYRIPKPVKPDFETAAVGDIDGKKMLFAFGSGSLSPTRDSLLMVEMDNVLLQYTIPVTTLYQHIQKTIGIKPEQWNLEGAAIVNDTLLLLNRGNNGVIEIDWTEFLAYVSDGILPDISHYTITIPQLERYIPRISGACAMDTPDEVLFCASIEDTPNWYTDGPVIGSGVGIFNMRTGKLVSFELIYRENGEIAAEKVESVELLSREKDGSLKLLAVVDDDQGSTKLLRLRWRK